MLVSNSLRTLHFEGNHVCPLCYAAEVGNAYEILKDPAKRTQYDHTGSIGGGGSGGGGSGGHPSQAEMLRQWQVHMMRQQQQQRRREPPPAIFPQAEMEACIR